MPEVQDLFQNFKVKETSERSPKQYITTSTAIILRIPEMNFVKSNLLFLNISDARIQQQKSSARIKYLKLQCEIIPKNFTCSFSKKRSGGLCYYSVYMRACLMLVTIKKLIPESQFI